MRAAWAGVIAGLAVVGGCKPRFADTGTYTPDSADSESDTSDTSDSSDTSDTSDTHSGDPLRPVVLNYVGWVATVTDTPLGMTESELAEMPVSGSMTYDLAVTDLQADDTTIGLYDHVGGRSRFVLNVAGHVIEGSTHGLTQLVVVGDRGTWRFMDGPQFADETERVMTVDGFPQREAELWYSMTRGSGFFPSDAQPDPWVNPNFEGPIDTSHTFKVQLADGLMLLQLESLNVDEG